MNYFVIFVAFSTTIFASQYKHDLVTASLEDRNSLIKLINALDNPAPQVIIESEPGSLFSDPFEPMIKDANKKEKLS